MIIPYRCLLHSSYCGGCSYQGFIGFVFFLFITFSGERVFFFFPLTFLPVQTAALETLFILVQLLLTRHSNQTGTVYWTTRCQVTHSLSHSHKPASPLPSAPFAVFAKRHLSLSEPDEKTYDHLNKHRRSMASLSARLWGEASFMWCKPVFEPVCVCVCTCLCFLYLQT